MNILMIYPKCPDTYWSFRHALRFISKKAAVPPLGLITVSAMLPSGWNKKLVDLNITALLNSDIDWADYVFISAMHIQRESVELILDECSKHSAKTVAGGPLFTLDFNNYPQIDHFILNEAEITMPLFLADLASGKTLQRIYKTDEYADITMSPIPDYHLLSARDYASMSIQITRGCPFSCDFCEITALLGHKIRMKSTRQILNELETLYQLNWQGAVSIVDDNFIGNKKEIKANLLPAMQLWMEKHDFPFVFNTQTTITLADDPELMSMMSNAGFVATFIGIETPEEESLIECNKVQNNNRNLLQNVKKIQNAGLQVSGGFIVGFDSDTPGVFQKQIDFIQQSGIVSAMVGLLNAPKNTKLHQRLKSENRLRSNSTGNNTDYSMNFYPKMNYHKLLEGYKSIIKNIYEVKPYYKRLRLFLMNYKPRIKKQNTINISNVKGFVKSMFIIGILNKGRFEYWKFLIWTLFRRPALFIDAITFTVYGYHYRNVFGLTGRNGKS